MPNQLIHETSPYLLQHAHNPVNWYPWGKEALQLAREQDKPILLSIGYAACHWCHVMAHESFEDEATAVFMNNHFINIKVDREERPDLDAIYMNAVVAMTGQGGWPMTVALTPQGQPFFGGTYFPPTPRYQMPSFMQVLQAVTNIWQSKRDEINNSAADLTAHLQRNLPLSNGDNALTPGLFRRTLATIHNNFDAIEGGFGKAPKFPPSMTLEFLLWMHYANEDKIALHMAEVTLQKMAYSGMYDQLGGGFARYATDDEWLVPHFEKMLYDNALLARAYLHAWQVTGKPLYQRIAEETLDFVARDMRHESGGFYSSYDADSEGKEGKFYVWSAAKVQTLLGDEAALFMRFYDVSAGGNWEGHNILRVKETPEAVAQSLNLEVGEMAARLETARQTLLAVRVQRVWPGLDDKVLTAWNGLMLAAFAEAGRALNRPDYTQIAVQNAVFLYETMRDENGRLHRTWKAGHAAKYNGYLEDYAYLADGLLALYQTTFDGRWFTWVRELTDLMLTHFHDEANGGFFDTSDDHENLLHRPKDVQDNATPSANAMAARVLLHMSLYTGDGRYWDVAAQATASLHEAMAQYPTSFAHWLGNAAFILSQPREVAIVGKRDAADTAVLRDAVFARYRPDVVVALGNEGDGEIVPLLMGRPLHNGKATAYVCRRFVCQQPVTDPETLLQQLDQ
ncbi:MAG: thioredoxin domain-containing protein [Ardenticatenaceae bacterium]|nr:thioredoxin domain-containing protein [Anaerolineales bacterium]MCB8920464.1 thioredoxin domain-containing protein [Ardenticatenaceae bacterium]MCB8989419.1 thioredoxin domain-containing protein [Ardenticatenaceae bacterium]MCB9004574.1 thioredoxin domain-containing protein [Ardenticatenaceae bacterium]